MSTLTRTKDTNGNTGMIVKRVSVPIGLEELMEGLSKEVILKKPKDIYLFASEYFAKLINLREKSNIYKSHPVRTMQSVTKLKHENIPPVMKISTPRPTKHLSRQLSIHSKSPVRQKLIQKEIAAKRNITKSRERKISTDRKDSSAKDIAKTELSRDITRASNKKGGTSTGTSSVQSTPREKRQSSVTRKVKSSAIHDPNKAREINNKTQKIQKRNKNDIVKTALIVPTVIGGSAVAANIVEAADDNIIKESKKNPIINSTNSAAQTKLSLTTKEDNNTGLLKSVIQVDKGNTDKLKLDDHPEINKPLDSDILAQSTNVTEVAKNISRSKEESETLRNQKVDVLLNSGNNSHVNSLEKEGEQLKDEDTTADQENINQEAKPIQIKTVSHVDETSLDKTTQDLVSIKSRQSSVEGNDLELDKTDKETIQDRLPDNISTKVLLEDDKDIEKQFANAKDFMQSPISQKAAEDLRNDSKLHVETSKNMLDNISESILKVDAKKEDEYLKSDERKNDISSEEKTRISDITIQEKGPTEEVKETLGDKINNDHPTSMSEADSSDTMPSNLRIDNLITQQRSDVQDNYNNKSNTESVETHVKENIDFDQGKGTEAENNIVNSDICHEDATKQEKKDNKHEESNMTENVITLEKREKSMEIKEIQDFQEKLNNAPEEASTHEDIKEGQLTVFENKNISNSEIQVTSVTTAPTSGSPENKSTLTSESQGSDTEVKDKVQESQMNMTEEQNKDSENVKAVEHQLSDLLPNEHKNSAESNEDQLKNNGAKEKTIQTSDEKQQNIVSEVNAVLNTNDQGFPVEITDFSNKAPNQNNIVTIKMEKSASVKSDDVLTVSILDNVDTENNIKEGDNDGNTNKIARSVENIGASSNDTKQERNQFFRKDEELASKEDDKTNINNESSDSEVIKGSQDRSEKVLENIKDGLSDHPHEMDSSHESGDIPKQGISPVSNLDTEETKYIKETVQKPHKDDLLNIPYLPTTEKESDIDNLHSENLNPEQNNITANNEVTKKIIKNELSKHLPGLIDSSIKQFLGSFINNEQINVFKNRDIASLENDEPSTNKSSEDEPEEHIGKMEDETIGVKEGKDTDAKSNKNSKEILPTESIEVYAGNPLIFSSVKDLLDFDTDNAFKSGVTKISVSPDKENFQALNHDKDNTEMVENKRNDTETLENDSLNKNDLIKNEVLQDKNKINITEGKEIEEGGKQGLQNSTESEIMSNEFGPVKEENINMDENAKKTLKVENRENVPIDEQTKTEIGSLEIHPKMSTSINEENTTEKNTNGTASDIHNTTTAKSVEDHIGSKQENINTSFLGDVEADEKLKQINETLGSDHVLENTIIDTKTPEYVDKKDDTVHQIDDKIIELTLKSENVSKIETTPFQANSSDTVLNSQQPQNEFKQNLSISNIINSETDNNVQVGSTENKISYDNATKDEVDNNIVKSRNSENGIISTNNHPNMDDTKEISSEDVIKKMYTNNDIEENRRNLSLNSVDTPKENARNKDNQQQQTGEIASALNTVKNIVSSKISVQKPGILDTSVSQYLTSFLGNEQSNVFQDKSIEQNKSEVIIDKSKEQSSIKTNKPITDKENVKNDGTGSKIKKGNTNELISMKMERSHSQVNVLSNDGYISELAIKPTKMRRVRSVGLIKSGENEHKSKIPTSARRSAGRRPLVRQLETDSKDIEETLNIKKDLDKGNQDARHRSDEEVLQSSKSIKKKTKKFSDETETDKITDKRQEGPKEPLIEKNMNKIDFKQDVVTKEDVLIAKTILKGIEGAEKHIELIEEKISPNESNTKLVNDSTHKAVVDTSMSDPNTIKDKKENMLYVGKQSETMPQEKYESPNETENETHVKSKPIKDIQEILLENRADDKAMSEKDMLSNVLLESDSKQTINTIVVTKTLPATSEDIYAEKNHFIDPNNTITETNKSNPSYEVKDNTWEIKAITEEVHNSEQENPEKYILENVITDKLEKTTTNNAQKGLVKKMKDNNDGAEVVEDEAFIKRELKAQNLKESNAAVKIQSHWRGYAKRKLMESSNSKFNQKSNRRKLKQEEAIVKIQAVVRGHLDRLKYQRLKEKNTTISISADTLNNETQKVTMGGESNKSLVENNGNLLEKGFADSTIENNLKERKVSDNNLKAFSVENKKNKESGEHLDDNINPVENNYITDKENIASDIKHSNDEEQPQASVNQNTILSNQEHMNDDSLKIVTTQNKDKLAIENGKISEINTDQIKEEATSDKTVDQIMEGRNDGKDIEKKLNVTENLKDQGEVSTDKNEQKQNINAAGSQDISTAANTNNSELSHDELSRKIEDTCGDHLENTFTNMVEEKDSENRETKSIDVYPNNNDNDDDNQKVVNNIKYIEKSLNEHINKESSLHGEISSNNNLNDINVDKDNESIEHIESQENLNDENISGGILNKQIKETGEEASKGSNLSKELIETNTSVQNLSENTLDKISVEKDKNIDNISDQIKNTSKEIESVQYNNREDTVSNDGINGTFKQDSENGSNDYSNDKASGITTKLDDTTDQKMESFKQEHDIHEADREKPYFYRSDTVVEPNNVKKIVSRLGEDDAIKNGIKNQPINDNIEWSAKDDNNNTESKDETELESEVRSTVNKILKDNIKPMSSIEIEINEAVKNIMENNIDNNKPTSGNNSINQSEIGKGSEHVEKKESSMLSQLSSHDMADHLPIIKIIEKNEAQTLLSEITEQANKTTSDDVSQAVHDVLKEGVSDSIPPAEKDKSVDQSSKKENNVILSTISDVRDSSNRDLKNDAGPKNIEENETQTILFETNLRSQKPSSDIDQTIDASTKENDSRSKTDQETLYQSIKNENNIILSADPDTDRDFMHKGLQNDIDPKHLTKNRTHAMLSETENLTPIEKDQSTKNEHNLILSTAPDNVSDLYEKNLQNGIESKNLTGNETQAMLSDTENLTPTEKDQPTKNENNLILSIVPDNVSNLSEKNLQHDIDSKILTGNGTQSMLSETEKDQSTKIENHPILLTAPNNVNDLSEKNLQSDSKNIDANGTQAILSETNVQPGSQTILADILKTGTSKNRTPTENGQSTKNENNRILLTAPDNLSDLKEKSVQNDKGSNNIDANMTQAMISETNIQSDKTENDTARHDTPKEAISYHVAPTEKDQAVDQSTINKNIILSSTSGNVNDLSDNDLKDDKDPSHSEINADDVSSVDSVDSVITVVPNVNYDSSIQVNHVSSGYHTLPNRSLSHDIITENKDESNKNLAKKSLSTDALDGHVELLDQVQKTLLDQLCGKPVNTASKFDIEQLRKELHEASSLYKEENEDPDFATHHDELLEYLNDFEPEDENTYDSKIIRTPVRELPDIEEEIDASADDTETITRRASESKPDQQLPEFCKTPSSTSVKKCIDNKPLQDHVEILNLEKLKQGHNEIIINNDNIQINRTETDKGGKQITEDNDQKLLHTSELHDSVVIPMDSSSRTALVHSGRLRHTSEFHDTLVVPLPSGSDVNIKNEAKEMLAKDKLPEPTRTESVDTGNQTAFQQSPAGAPIVTSRRISQNGVDDGDAQASLRDTSPAKPKSVESFTHQSQPQLPRFVKQDMESENNNNKRNNAISTKVSSPGKNMEAEAATKIQAGFRGYQVRKQMKSKNVADKSNLERHQLRRKSSGRKIMKDTDLAEKSAVKIQAGVRGFLVRRRQKKQLNSSASA